MRKLKKILLGSMIMILSGSAIAAPLKCRLIEDRQDSNKEYFQITNRCGQGYTLASANCQTDEVDSGNSKLTLSKTREEATCEFKMLDVADVEDIVIDGEWSDAKWDAAWDKQTHTYLGGTLQLNCCK